MQKIKITGTGLNGLVGSRIVECLNEIYDFTNISRSTGVDITNAGQVNDAIIDSDADVVLHLTAKTDVDECEKDKESDIDKLRDKEIKVFENSDSAWAINVVGTQNIVDACKKTNKKLIYISTDFVFDGENTPEEGYAEDQIPNPINWYAKTKYEGEKIVTSSGLPFIIIRLAFPYGKPFEKKKDFVQAILSRLKNGQSINAVTDQIFMPTFIDDIAAAVDVLIKKNAEGLYHVVGSQELSPYEAALLIAKTFDLDASFISKTTREEFFKNRAKRPYKLLLKHDRIEQLGVKTRSFEEGLKEIKIQNSKVKNTI